MKLSELVAQCAQYDGADPVLTAEDRNGIPVPIGDVDFGVMRLADGSHTAYVVLTPAEMEG